MCFPLAFVGSLELCTQASHLQMNSFAHVLIHMPFLSFPPLRVLAVTSVLCQVAVLRTGTPLSFLSLGGIQSFSSKCGVSCSVFRFSIDVIYQISLHFLFSERFYIDECWILSNDFLASVNTIVCLLLWYGSLCRFSSIKLALHSRVEFYWLLCIIIFIYCWIPFVDVL